jgi:hypothetical protein
MKILFFVLVIAWTSIIYGFISGGRTWGHVPSKVGAKLNSMEMLFNFNFGGSNGNKDSRKPGSGACSKLETVQVGELALSRIGCGTWSWGNRFLWGYSPEDDAELQRTYDYITAKGVNWFDTADSYGTGNQFEGQSEKLLGKFRSSSSSGREGPPYFATKLAPFPWRIGPSSMLSAAAKSRSRLSSETHDILQLHWPPSFGTLSSTLRSYLPFP